ncbi:hypothetical protein IFM89_005839 [Coptis chinensis]|uniref:Bet v I/Major latex protein domain-containing protein n=1 Tax=Coptis chinensis TaxID=261450 RepID=A0A835GWK8_9MAGN|nr:hypothetical protein IFM89_005839 [Coptis chinensis]
MASATSLITASTAVSIAADTTAVRVPGEERNIVKWTVEYEKENEDMPDPHDYMDLYSVENDKLDAYLVSKCLN